MQQNSLKNICGYSFPGNHLLQFSLVQQKQEQVYKKEYFFFITCAPGENQNGGRTFNFQNRFTMKLDIDKIISLRHALIMYATGRQQMIGQFSIFVDSSKSNFNQGGGTKSIYLNEGKDKNNNPLVTLLFKLGSNKGISYMMTIPAALSISDILKTLTDKALKLEFGRTNIQIQPSTIKSNDQQFNNSQPPPQQFEQNNGNNNSQPPPQQFEQNNGNNNSQNVANNFANSLNNIATTEVPF